MEKPIREALDLLEKVTGELQTTRNMHIRIQNAIRLLEIKLTPAPEGGSGTPPPEIAEAVEEAKVDETEKTN